jgi:hypothetical protein
LNAITRAWLFVRGAESIRIVIEGTSVAVYGPGRRVSHSDFREVIDAALHQASVEQSLVRDGWTLERLTTERRVPRATVIPHAERRRTIRLIRRDGHRA